jgi:CheY-like chemotaxis protein
MPVFEQPILLVEDNCDDEFLALRTLKKMGLDDVKVARDGREAITMLEGNDRSAAADCREAPRMMLLDLRLPKLDGLEVLRMVRENERTRNMQVCILTSSEDPHDREVCSELGVLAFLTKPLSVKAFSEVLRQSGS